jgi:hypothetical protein
MTPVRSCLHVDVAAVRVHISYSRKEVERVLSKHFGFRELNADSEQSCKYL